MNEDPVQVVYFMGLGVFLTIFSAVGLFLLGWVEALIGFVFAVTAFGLGWHALRAD